MNKQKLIKFISKYYLNGTVNSVILTGELNKLKTRFISGDKTLLGELEMNSWNFGDCEIGVYNTEQLLKLLLVLFLSKSILSVIVCILNANPHLHLPL